MLRQPQRCHLRVSASLSIFQDVTTPRYGRDKLRDEDRGMMEHAAKGIQKTVITKKKTTLQVAEAAAAVAVSSTKSPIPAQYVYFCELFEGATSVRVHDTETVQSLSKWKRNQQASPQ